MANTADADEATDAHDAPQLAPQLVPQLAPNPDAQTTVNDFLDYTDFFPSDLVRSLSLIADLDASYADAVHHVHDLTALYGRLPALPQHDRPDPAHLRRTIARHLNKAIAHREYAYSEAHRLHEVALRHCQRSHIIKRKLRQQPEPPSRDPTPPPVSPTAARNHYRPYDRMRLSYDGPRRHGPSGARSRALSTSSSSDDSDAHSALATAPKRLKLPKDRSLKTPRVRMAGVAGTNVHSSVAGISTSNALAKLSPPPPDARPGSRWAPWMRLTEYEMAVLRKQMKKNAVWTPSLTMVNRELERKHRTKADYEREMARCEAAGETILDEEPESVQQTVTPQPAADLTVVASSDPAHDDLADDTAAHPTRDTRRRQAMRAVQDLENATRKLQDAADGLKELTFSAHDVTTPSTQTKPMSARLLNKRKRDSTPTAAAEDHDHATRETSVASNDSDVERPEQKRPRLQLTASAPESATPSTATPISTRASTPEQASVLGSPSPVAHTPTPDPESKLSEAAVPSTKQVPLAPAGPSTPKVIVKPTEKTQSRQPTPALLSPTESKAPSALAAPVSSSVPPQSTVTAASSRPRRESVVHKGHSPPRPSKSSTSATPVPDLDPSTESAFALRTRPSRGHVPTPKAQSEEPNPNEAGRVTRRHSIFSQSALTAPASTRMSTRRKPPPKGEITASEHGQKTVTNVKRAQGSKNKRKKKTEEEPDLGDEIDPDEPRYCICDDVSYGPMISCDNNCDKEWFHLPCMNMAEEDIPSRRAKWYCPDCRESLGTDAYGNPKVPPPLPGRRGNRGDGVRKAR